MGDSARISPAGGAGLARLATGFWNRGPAGMGCAGRACRSFWCGRGRLPFYGHISLGGGLAGAVHRAAACGMGGSGGLGVRPRSCRARLRTVGLLRRGAFRSRSCHAGMGRTGPLGTPCPRRTRRRVGRAGGQHIAVGVAGSRPHRASPGLLGPSAAPGSIRRGAAGMFLLGGCLGGIFLPGAGLLGGTLLAAAVVGIPAAATRAAEILGTVPSPAVPPIAAKGIVRPSATLRSALGSLAAA